MTYRHCTNMRVPLEPIDMDFLLALGDYRLGLPVPSKATEDSTPLTLAQLKEQGIVGLYVTVETLKRPLVVARTGWSTPERVLGRDWSPV